MLVTKGKKTLDRPPVLFFGRCSLFLDGSSSQLFHIRFDREALRGGLIAEPIGDRDGDGHVSG